MVTIVSETPITYGRNAMRHDTPWVMPLCITPHPELADDRPRVGARGPIPIPDLGRRHRRRRRRAITDAHGNPIEVTPLSSVTRVRMAVDDTWAATTRGVRSGDNPGLPPAKG